MNILGIEVLIMNILTEKETVDTNQLFKMKKIIEDKFDDIYVELDRKSISWTIDTYSNYICSNDNIITRTDFIDNLIIYLLNFRIKKKVIKLIYESIEVL